MAIKLTDRVAATRTCPEGKRSHLYADASGNGLVLVVMATGRRFWKYRFDYAGRRNDIITLGEASLLSYEDAKTLAQTYQRALKIDKRDPRSLVFNPATAATLDDVLDAYEAKTATKAQATVKSSFKPIRKRFGKTTMRDLDRNAVRVWLDEEYQEGNGKPNRGGACATMLRYLGAAIRHAMRDDSGVSMPEGYVFPFHRLNREVLAIKDRVRRSHAVNWEDDQFTSILGAIRTGFDSEKCQPIGVMVVSLCLFTGARPSEIESLRWDEIHAVPGQPTMLRIIKDKHKTYARTGRPRQITLGARGVAVIDRAKAHHAEHGIDSPWVFPIARDQKNTKTPHFNSTNQVCRTLSSFAGMEIRPYQFRSAYINHALEAAESGTMATYTATLSMVAENVGHSNTIITQSHYVRSKASQTVTAITTTDAAFDRFDIAA